MPVPVSCAGIDAVVRERMGDTRRLTNQKNAVFPRAVSMYLMRRAGHSLPQIGRVFRSAGKPNGMHHTTVLHAVQKITEQRSADAQLDAQIAEIEALIDARFPGGLMPKPMNRTEKIRAIVREELAAIMSRTEGAA